jgi:hypothetical protein
MTKTDQIARFDEQNLALARKVQQTPWLYRHLVAWSVLVIKRLGTDQERERLAFEDTLEEKKR